MNTIQTVLEHNNKESESIWNRDVSYHETISDLNELCPSQTFVYDVIKSHSWKGGITDQDISLITGMSLHSVNARRNELCKMNLIVDNGRIQYMDDRGRCRFRTLWVRQ